MMKVSMAKGPDLLPGIDRVWVQAVRPKFRQPRDGGWPFLFAESSTSTDLQTTLELRLVHGFGMSARFAKGQVTIPRIADRLSYGLVYDEVVETLTEMAEEIGLERLPPPPPRWRVDFRIGRRGQMKVTDRRAKYGV